MIKRNRHKAQIILTNLKINEMMFNKGIFKRGITMNRNWREKTEGGFFHDLQD
jgi:hypothetical protein